MARKNILGIDHGDRHIGIAISLDGAMPLGYASIDGSCKDIMPALHNVAEENDIDTIIVGMPSAGTHSGDQAIKIRKFVDILKKEMPGISVYTHDETLTSKMARRLVNKDKEHQEAARIILDDWMEANT